jgi:hypothetical protein
LPFAAKEVIRLDLQQLLEDQRETVGRRFLEC